MDRPEDRRKVERDGTDATLLAERSKADEEHSKVRDQLDNDAEEAAAVLQERAEETLQVARDRTDRATRSTPEEARLLELERAEEDRVLAAARESADESRRSDRRREERALSALLKLERNATDERLVVERTGADEVISARDDFLGMVSHDLRTLVSGIALNAAVLAREASDAGEGHAGYLRHADRIQRFAGRMNRLVGDLLDLVSLESGKLGVTARPLDPNQLLQDAYEAFMPAFAAKGLRLNTRAAHGCKLAAFDHDRILQVLANLLSNALKFGSEGDEVVLSVAPMGSDVCFSVSDQGPGIPEASRDTIFDRFHQVNPRERHGVGLGLYIAKCIVAAHGGKIWFQPREQGGSVFLFTLPGVDAAGVP